MLCRRSVEPGIGSASHRPVEDRGVGGSRGINDVDWGRNRCVDLKKGDLKKGRQAWGHLGVLALLIL